MWRWDRRRALRRAAWGAFVAICLAAIYVYLYFVLAVLVPAFRDFGEIP